MCVRFKSKCAIVALPHTCRSESQIFSEVVVVCWAYGLWSFCPLACVSHWYTCSVAVDISYTFSAATDPGLGAFAGATPNPTGGGGKDAFCACGG